MMQLAAAVLLALAQNDKTQANSYDDGWKGAWKAHCQAVLSGGSGKSAGLVLQIGDSITHSNPYSQWPRYGAGKTAEDDAVCTWALTTVGFPATQTDATNTNGFYLAAADTSGNRGMTASSGLDANEMVTGNGNGGTAMPADTVQSSARTTISDGTTYTANLQITTLAAAFSNAQFAVLMLGTNDIGGGRSTSAFIADLTTIVNTLEGQHIAVILSTIPPRVGSDVTAYNAAIGSLAQSVGLPLIDFCAEILARRPGTTWQNTLISGDGIHPTVTNAAADPYSPGGNGAANQTGTNCLNEGYLLRSWLTMQKLKEVKSYVIDNNPVPGPGPGPGPAPAPSQGGGGGGGGCGLTGLEAVALLALLRAARKSGF
jgi:lysophospholipase L1-like esterase